MFVNATIDRTTVVYRHFLHVEYSPHVWHSNCRCVENDESLGIVQMMTNCMQSYRGRIGDENSDDGIE